MNVSLTPELEQYVAGKVTSGLYQSASEVIREALRALREKEERAQKLAELRAEIDAGVDECDRGEAAPLRAGEILAEVRRKKAARRSGR